MSRIDNNILDDIATDVGSDKVVVGQTSSSEVENTQVIVDTLVVV